MPKKNQLEVGTDRLVRVDLRDLGEDPILEIADSCGLILLRKVNGSIVLELVEPVQKRLPIGLVDHAGAPLHWVPHKNALVTTLLEPEIQVDQVLNGSFLARLQRAIHHHALLRAREQGTLPPSWVAPERATEHLGQSRDLESDILQEPGAPAAGPLPETPAPPTENPASDAWVLWAHRSLCAQLGFGDIPLRIARPEAHQSGFVSGRIAFAADEPRWIELCICPNADLAEVWATLLHEHAHGLRPQAGHGPQFKATVLQIAEDRFGAAGFVAARAVIGERSSELDAWLAVCLRAVLNGDPPARVETGDEGQATKVVARVLKLRRLAESAVGTPEGISACARANDLLVRWRLGSYRVKLDAAIDESMCDVWLKLSKTPVWHRQLAFLVARHFGVFALHHRMGWMHLFGRYCDVVTAEYFFHIWKEHIEREADAHIQRERSSVWGDDRNARSIKVEFGDSAVYALNLRLDAMRRVSSDGSEDVHRVRQHAEQFAEVEHARRGESWGTARAKSISLNREGMAAGASAPMGRGLQGAQAPKGRIGGGP